MSEIGPGAERDPPPPQSDDLPGASVSRRELPLPAPGGPRPRRVRLWAWISAAIGAAIGLAILADVARNRFFAPSTPFESIGAGSSDPAPPEDIAKDFVMADGVEERISLLRDPADAPGVREHYARMQERGEEQVVRAIRPIGIARSQSVRFHRFLVQFKDTSARFLAIVDEGGRLSVDWPAYVRAGTATWDEILRGEVTRAEVRVFVRRGDYYNLAFADSTRHEAFELRSPDCDRTLYGYLERGGTRAQLLNQGLGPGSQLRRFTLVIETPPDDETGPGRETNQFRIAKLIAPTWVKDTVDLEDSPYSVNLPSELDAGRQSRVREPQSRALPRAGRAR